jgi:hypothetical protein
MSAAEGEPLKVFNWDLKLLAHLAHGQAGKRKPLDQAVVLAPYLKLACL